MLPSPISIFIESLYNGSAIKGGFIVELPTLTVIGDPKQMILVTHEPNNKENSGSGRGVITSVCVSVGVLHAFSTDRIRSYSTYPSV